MINRHVSQISELTEEKEVTRERRRKKKLSTQKCERGWGTNMCVCVCVLESERVGDRKRERAKGQKCVRE